MMKGIMLGDENNMLRPAPGEKFVPSYDRNRDMTGWAQNLGQYGQIIEKIWLRRLIWDNLEDCPNFCGHMYFVPSRTFPHCFVSTECQLTRAFDAIPYFFHR